MATRFNERTETEMETLTYEESKALAIAAGDAERINKFFANGQEFAWAEYVREAIAKPAKGRPVRMSDNVGGFRILGNGSDR